MTQRRRFDLLLLAALGIVICAAAAEAVRTANQRAVLRGAMREAATLDAAFRSYYRQHGQYPSSHAEAGLDRATLDPLRRRGYYDGSLTSTLVGGRVDAYQSPDDRGLNQEFWIEGTLERDPSVRILIASSDDAPLSGGRWMDGVFVCRNGVLDPE